MRFKIDVSDRETGELATLEVEAPTAQAARRHMQDAGYMVWATEPAPDRAAARRRSKPSGREQLLDRLADQAQEGTFRAHPIRFILSPLLRFAGIVLVFWSALAALLVAKGFPWPGPAVAPAKNIFWAACAVWIVGWWLGLPLARGRAAQRAWADAQIVCRYCRRRGNVTTSEKGILGRRRLWAQCGCCGIRWPL